VKCTAELILGPLSQCWAGLVSSYIARSLLLSYIVSSIINQTFIVLLILKKPTAIENTLSHKLEDARLLIQLKIVKSLKEYRNLYVVQHRLGGRLIFPESLKFLPLYALSLCKSIALRGGYADAPLDERCAAGYSMMILPVSRLLKLLYPSLLRVDEYLIKVYLLTFFQPMQNVYSEILAVNFLWRFK